LSADIRLHWRNECGSGVEGSGNYTSADAADLDVDHRIPRDCTLVT